jgi:uncharacterized protein YndB with AHSA1/START domain
LLRPLAIVLLLGLAGCHHHSASMDGLAAAGQVQPNAPLQVQLQISIKAPPAKIWALLSDAQGWPGWNDHITQVAAPAGLAGGSVFSWTMGGMSIQSTVHRFVPLESLAWTGHVLNFHAIHVWDLALQPDGSTVVTVRESISGFLIAWFYSRRDLRDDDQLWLNDLKAAAEKP